MDRKLDWFTVVAAAAGLLILSSCSRTTSTPETTAEPTMTTETQPTPSQPATVSPYPYPSPYPILMAPGNQIPSYPYPGPGGNQAYPPAQSPAAIYPYPGAYPTPEGASGPYPIPATTAPTTEATAKPTKAPNQEPVATDPSQVQLASGKVQLVEFFAFWDGASKSMAPMLNALAAEYDGKMNFVFLDVDNPANKKFKDALNYRIQPQFFLLDKQGSIIKQWQGYVDEAELRAAMDSALQ